MTLSRSVVALTLLLGAAPAQADIAMDRYRQVTSVEPRCSRPEDGREIMVCGARRADRWRVPYVGGYDVGDPRGESVEAERKRLSAAPRVPCGQGAIIANCGGGVGISMTTSFGAGRLQPKLRPLAP